jgi:hypothetical protein
MRISLSILALLAPLFLAAASLAAESYEKQRQTMLQRDIAGRGIRDSQVLAAMAKVPRHLLVARRYRDDAYDYRGSEPYPPRPSSSSSRKGGG